MNSMSGPPNGHSESRALIDRRANGRPAPFVSARRMRTESDLEQLLSPQFLLRVVSQWWKWIAFLALVLSAISCGVVWWLFEPQYRAAAWLRMEGSNPYLAYELRQDSDPMEQQRFVQTQLELLRSPLVIGPLVAKPEIAQLPELELATDPAGKIAGGIGIESVGNSELFIIQYDSPDPKSAATVVNSVLDGYFDLVNTKAAERDLRVVELLEQEKDRRSGEVMRLRARMRELGHDLIGSDAVTSGAGDLIVNHPLSNLHTRLTDAEVERRVLQATVQAMDETSLQESDFNLTEEAIERAIDQTPDVQQLTGFLAQQQVNLKQIAAMAAQGERSGTYQRAKKQTEELEQRLAETRTAMRPVVLRELRAAAANDHRRELTRLKQSLQTQVVLEDLLKDRYATKIEELGNSNDQSLELEFTRAELAREERVFELIAQRVVALRTEMRAPGRVTLMRRASPPSRPVSRVPLVGFALSLLGSLAFPTALGFLWEYRLRRVTDAEQLEQLPNLPVVAEVTKLPARRARKRKKLSRKSERALDLFEESIDSFRSYIVLPETHADVQVLAVTSAVPAEGKTSVACKLADSIGRATGDTTLLIDADLRAPDVHRCFEIDNQPGFAEVLAGQVALRDAIVSDWSERIHLLPAGVLSSSPHQLMGGTTFKEAIAELRSMYRHIVIDTPPVLAASEALVVAKEADGTVICAMRERSREAQVKKAYERLVGAGGRPLGAVLNAVPTRHYSYTYGNYSYSK